MSYCSGQKALEAALEIFGTQTALANAIGVSQQSVNQAFKKKEIIAPPKWCIPLEKATGGKITRHDLRPDLYPKEDA
jgi:DNA-binding transcriptional regulator YdaS (Cro superfamily)